MATKHFCDGCGEERARVQLTAIAVTYTVPADAAAVKQDEADLCASCVETFRYRHLPSRWPRFAPAPQEAA